MRGITEPLNKAVDTLPCIDLVDVFEVGSPGLDRQLRKPFHFVKMKGEKIKVTVRDENGKTAYYSGILGDYDENSGAPLQAMSEPQKAPLCCC